MFINKKYQLIKIAKQKFIILCKKHIFILFNNNLTPKFFKN